MGIYPILLALRRNKTGAILIGLQIALTLAILCNSLSIVQQLVERMREPTGIDEANIFTIGTERVNPPANLRASIEDDLAALRSIPGVIDANFPVTFPLSGVSYGSGIMLKPDQRFPTATANLYFADEHGLATYGLKLAAGRWFTAAEVGELRYYENHFPPTMVVTRTLAKALFPDGSALGKVVYLPPHQTCRIVGIIEDVQAPNAANGGSDVDRSVYMPMVPMNAAGTYVVRAKPGQLLSAMRAAPDALYRLDPQRIIRGTQTFAEIRRQAYSFDRAISVMLGTVCAALLAVTAFGVVGLTMYWVTQRRQFIGMRRALGARRLDILQYFHTENLLIAGAGGALGIGLGLGANLLLAQSLELTRLGVAYISVGALIVLGLCQVAVLWPSLRAAQVAPAIAIRGL